MEETIKRIMSRASLQATSKTSKSQTTQTRIFHFSCNECEDTGWIRTENNSYRKCKCVELDHARRLWENFGMNPTEVKKLNEYKPYNNDTTTARSKAIEYITKFNSIRSTRENSFALMGQSGAGKTHIVLAISRALIEQRVAVVYMPYLEAMRELKSNVLDDEYYNKLINRYQRSEVLIIDDLFKDKVKNGALVGQLTEADMKHIYPILNYRYNNKIPTLVSTECTPEMLDRLDSALGGRILESCNEFGVVFGKECNYRLRKYRGNNG